MREWEKEADMEPMRGQETHVSAQHSLRGQFIATYHEKRYVGNAPHDPCFSEVMLLNDLCIEGSGCRRKRKKKQRAIRGAGEWIIEIMGNETDAVQLNLSRQECRNAIGKLTVVIRLFGFGFGSA